MNRLLRLFVWLSCVGILRTKMGLALWLNPVIRCTMRRRLLCGTFETLGLRCPNGASGPNRTFMTFAANGSLEPTPDLLILCCVRSQRGNCCISINSHATVLRENRSFMPAAARMRRPRIKSRTKLLFWNIFSWSVSIHCRHLKFV